MSLRLLDSHGLHLPCVVRFVGSMDDGVNLHQLIKHLSHGIGLARAVAHREPGWPDGVLMWCTSSFH